MRRERLPAAWHERLPLDDVPTMAATLSGNMIMKMFRACLKRKPVMILMMMMIVMKKAFRRNRVCAGK